MAKEAEPPVEEAPAPPPRRGFLRRHWIGTTIAAVLLIPGFVFTVWAGVTLNFSYSDGTRSGFVQRLSRKGWVCKTWEGELAMTTQPGVAPQIFPFTVRVDSIAQEVTKLEGSLVSLHYKEHPGVPSTCFGETSHFVDGVTRAQR